MILFSLEHCGARDRLRPLTPVAGRSAILGTIDFVPTWPTVLAFASGAALPAYLLLLTRCGLARDPARKLIAGGAASVVVWGVLVAAVPGAAANMSGLDLLNGLCALGAFFIGFGLIWGVMTRGYTFAMLVEFHRAGGPLTEEALAAAYSGGRGLSWLFEKRLGGIHRLGLIVRDGGDVALTPAGRFVAFGSRVALRVLGLKRFG